MQFLTVTCNRDRWLFELQLQSFKFLKSFKLHVVINEDDPSGWLSWFNTLDCNFVTLYYKKDFTNIADGWVSQQLIKLYFANHIDEDYVVLDSKNFFTKNINNIVNTYRTNFNNFKQTQQVLGFNKYVSPSTPYVLKSKIVKEIIKNNFEQWFLSLDQPSEFLVYDAYLQEHNIHCEFDNPISKTLWYYEIYDYNQWCKLDHAVLGIHPLFIKMNPNINWKKWLAQKDLELPVSPIPSLPKLDWNKICG